MWKVLIFFLHINAYIWQIITYLGFCFIYMYTKCGCEVPEIILLRDLKGVMLFDRSVHVSSCTSYDFNVLTLVMCKLWR